ncbi:MAG: ComF family protein [Solirubrobacterales bacterium]|nr:ComF family protein [Solirubrobacterales bacterium]
MNAGRLARWAVPSSCPLCRSSLGPDALICGGCVRELNRSQVLRGDPPEGVDRISSCADHDGTARDLLAAFKFRRMTGLSGLIAGFMLDALDTAGPETLITGVPPARLRTWIRGFDPVALLVAGIADGSDVSLPVKPLLRRHGAGRQRGQDRAGRLARPPDIRPAKDSGRLIGGREVILVDDVMTTGATLSASAAALRLAGAGTVSALTFTRRL